MGVGGWFVDKVLVYGRPGDAPLIERGDIDGFFAFFMNTLMDFTLTISIGNAFGFDMDLIVDHVLPATAIITFLGNAYYWWEARMLMRTEKRHDVCALPFGIATPSLLAFFNLIMKPVIDDSNFDTALNVAFLNTLITGFVTLTGLFYGSYLRNEFPKAAMLSGLAGIGITLISMDFVFSIFAKPYLAFLPFFFFMYMLLSNCSLPYRIPMGVVLVLGGTGIGWFLRAIDIDDFEPYDDDSTFHYCYPKFFYEFFSDFGTSAKYLTVSIPLAVINLVGSLQNLISAEGTGDRFKTKATIIVNGALMMLSPFIGNPFPTTLYIGQPMYKRLGARAAYSFLNGLVILILCSFGGVNLILRVMPQEALYPILMIIGVGICAESFEAVPTRHYIAVAFGLIPAFSSWGLGLIQSTIDSGNAYLKASHNITNAMSEEKLYAYFGQNRIPFDGVVALSQGFLLVSLGLTAGLCYFVDRQHIKACLSMVLLASLSFVGLIHGYTWSNSGAVDGLYVGQSGASYGSGYQYSIMYMTVAAAMVVLYFTRGDVPIDYRKENEELNKVLKVDSSQDVMEEIVGGGVHKNTKRFSKGESGLPQYNDDVARSTDRLA
eukprot:Nk52_evm16s307 gene=Nk52_evmTU16s307